jgi:methylmalonyl-CoA mutase N-terminal domain/subunit
VKTFQQARNPITVHPERRPQAARGEWPWKATALRSEEVEGQRQSAAGSLSLLQAVARDRKNVFEQLIEAVKYNSLGQISHALYDVGGEYRRNM